MPGQTFTLAWCEALTEILANRWAMLASDEEMGELAELLIITSLSIILLAALFWCVRLPYR